MHRTTVMIPDDLFSDALARARSEGVSVAELIRKGLEQVVGGGKGGPPEKDPFFADDATFASGIGDAALRHDDYLYGGVKR